ncbi:hypothetical protein LCGC14_1400220 [marine sediment metagenome]|uniref:Uncharacterized protein n=1 Tax=marine sediment metagenome TaxID=412755 RepID=A0A0F9MCV4_9ZZZZ
MNDDFSTLDYDGELTDDEPMRVIHLSSYWLDKLVGVAEILKSRRIWNSFDDVDLALRQVDDLIVRLMGDPGGEDMMRPVMPLFIPAVAMYFNPDLNPTYDLRYDGVFLNAIAYTDGTDERGIIATITMPLTVGTYIFTLYYWANTDRGNCRVTATGFVNIIPFTDMYEPSQNAERTVSGELIVTKAQVYEIVIEKTFKNPASSACYIVLFALSVRLKDASE